jgi:hypothetical protein
VAEGCGLPTAFDAGAARQLFDGLHADAFTAAIETSDESATAQLLRTLAGISKRLGPHSSQGLHELMDAARQSLSHAAMARLREAVSAGEIEQAILLASYPTGKWDGLDVELSRRVFERVESEALAGILVCSGPRSLAALLETLDAVVSDFSMRNITAERKADELRAKTWEALIHVARRSLQSRAAPSEIVAAVSAVLRVAASDPLGKEPSIRDPLAAPAVVESPVVFEFNEGSSTGSFALRDAKSAIRALFDGVDPAALAATFAGEADVGAFSDLVARLRVMRHQITDDPVVVLVIDELVQRADAQVQERRKQREAVIGSSPYPERQVSLDPSERRLHDPPFHVR